MPSPWSIFGSAGPPGPPGPPGEGGGSSGGGSSESTLEDDIGAAFPTAAPAPGTISVLQGATPARGEQPYYDGKWKAVGDKTSSTDLGNANANLDVNNASSQILPTSVTLTATRSYTAPAPAASVKSGAVFNYIRLNTDAQATQVLDGVSGNVIFPSGADAEPTAPYILSLIWDGTNWQVAGYSSISINV